MKIDEQDIAECIVMKRKIVMEQSMLKCANQIYTLC